MELAMAKVRGTQASETIDKLRGVTENGDIIDARGGDDTVYGLGGDDLIIGGYGADHLDGGTGVDTASYAESYAGVYVDLASGKGRNGTAEGDTLAAVENLTGSWHNDTLVGDSGDNKLRGLGGDDLLTGGGGRDWLQGEDGNDRLKGGGGDDILQGGDGNDTLRGEEGDDWLYGGLGDDDIVGGAGLDYMRGHEGADAFVWRSTDETGATVLTADRIFDFNFAEGDRINLSFVDADVYAPGNQAFTFIGTAAFSGTPGEINYYHDLYNTYIQLQTGTSPDVEAVIWIYGHVTPDASWFVL
jgi:Ca2+-binding RTX toxin-like protein